MTQAPELNYDQTHLSLSEHEDWPVADGAQFGRVGWLDQKGRVWTAVPPFKIGWDLGCGSFTPLLIQLDD
jgi:hypothetical protein